MDINQLVYFISVAQTLNFSEAARRNYVSQSTVSRYVSDLEKEFGVKLFTRSHRDVVITNEGKTLLPYAIETVETLNKAKNVIKQMRDGGNGKLTIASDATSLSFPSKCIAEFNSNYSGVTIDLCQLDVNNITQNIIGEEYDFCFMPRDMLPENTEIDSVLTHTEPLVVIASKDGKFGKRDSISFSELADEKLLLLSESIVPIIYMEIMDLLRTFHISPTIESTYNDLISLYIGVNAGVGVTIIPKSLAEYSTNEHTKTILIEDTDTGVPYVMAWTKSISNPVARLFLNVANNFAKGDEDIFGL